MLDEAGYTPQRIQALLFTDDELLARTRELPVHLMRLEDDESALAVLTKLFLLSVDVDVALAERALAPFTLDELEQLGTVTISGETVQADVRVVPHDDLMIGSDRAREETGASHVAGVHGPSATLAHMTVRRDVDRALDMGTGNGIQALLLSRHARDVVATDVNDRALAFAEFNAALNDVDNIEFRQGSFFEPVVGEQFDVVVTNPPYVVSPESEYLFRDSGLGRDRVSEDVVRALPTVLAPGGFATVMVSWIDSGDGETVRPQEWLEGSGCDAWIFHMRSEDALTTAAAWNADALDSVEYERRIRRWVDYYRAEAIGGLGYGAVVMRRRNAGADGNWIRSAQPVSGELSSASDQLQRMFAAQDFLAREPDLLETSFAFTKHAVLEQQLAPTELGWTAREITLTLLEGLGLRAGLDPTTARIAAALRPGTPLREALDSVALEIGTDAEKLYGPGVDFIRSLLEYGLLEPARD